MANADPLPADLRAVIAREASAFGASRGYSPNCDCKICGPALADMRDRLERIARLGNGSVYEIPKFGW